MTYFNFETKHRARVHRAAVYLMKMQIYVKWLNDGFVYLQIGILQEIILCKYFSSRSMTILIVLYSIHTN